MLALRYVPTKDVLIVEREGGFLSCGFALGYYAVLIFVLVFCEAAVDFAGEVHTFKSRHQARTSRKSSLTAPHEVRSVRSKDRGFGSLESGAAAAAASRASRAAASPAIASSNDPRDADDVARPPSPSRLVSANTMTSPPSAAISAFPQTGNGGKLVPVPPQSDQSDQSDQSNVPTNAPKHKVHKHAVQPATQIGKQLKITELRYVKAVRG